MKRPIPIEVAMFGSLDVHTVDALTPTFTKPEVALQTTASPASMVGALHASARSISGKGVIGTPPPHADAINRAALSATMRLIRVARRMIAEPVGERVFDPASA
jgi:hypothetical protein